jgi:flagellar assembly protein FliH
MRPDADCNLKIQFKKQPSRIRVVYAGLPPVPGDHALKAEQQAYERGHAAASRVYEQQILEQRQEMNRVQTSVLEAIGAENLRLNREINERLPHLVMAIVRKIVGGMTLEASHVNTLAEEVLQEMSPQGEDVELYLSIDDFNLLKKFGRDRLQGRFPGLVINEDSALEPGDVMLRSRFGLVDARMKTKLAKIEREITGSES